jgi:hypothetical protein
MSDIDTKINKWRKLCTLWILQQSLYTFVSRILGWAMEWTAREWHLYRKNPGLCDGVNIKESLNNFIITLSTEAELIVPYLINCNLNSLVNMLFMVCIFIALVNQPESIYLSILPLIPFFGCRGRYKLLVFAFLAASIIVIWFTCRNSLTLSI